VVVLSLKTCGEVTRDETRRDSKQEQFLARLGHLPTERTGRLQYCYCMTSSVPHSSTCLFCHAWGTTG
jgi:hypothetical protein